MDRTILGEFNKGACTPKYTGGRCGAERNFSSCYTPGTSVDSYMPTQAFSLRRQSFRRQVVHIKYNFVDITWACHSGTIEVITFLLPLITNH